MEEKKITKTELARRMGISRPTLNRYLKEGFPLMISEKDIERHKETDIDRKRMLIENEIKVIENEIRLQEYDLSKLKEELENLNKVEKVENNNE